MHTYSRSIYFCRLSRSRANAAYYIMEYYSSGRVCIPARLVRARSIHNTRRIHSILRARTCMYSLEYSMHTTLVASRSMCYAYYALYILVGVKSGPYLFLFLQAQTQICIKDPFRPDRCWTTPRPPIHRLW